MWESAADRGISAELLEHPGIRAVSFVGSVLPFARRGYWSQASCQASASVLFFYS